jgi:hypothetical protein
MLSSRSTDGLLQSTCVTTIKGRITVSATPAYLRRYTDLTSLLHILSVQEITLLDPKSWDDRNDAYFMSQYKERKKLESLLALCFSQVPETYHHWHVFSKGPSGVLITFNRDLLLDVFRKHKELKFDSLDYLTLEEAKIFDFALEKLPFIKRFGYKPEKEFRVIFESKTRKRASVPVPISPECIRNVTLSPWLHDSLHDSVVQSIQAIEGFNELKVNRSTLISNEVWKGYATGL